MLKQTPIDISQTNMALFGTPLEKEIKLRAAQGEPAWKTAGKVVGVQCWRVEKFEIKEWPKDRFGQVYNGDSYIFLHTYEVENVKKWNVHFWLGTYTSQDEAGTAAYKTVELDDFLGGAPVQYREVQGNESSTFLALFPHGLKILNGGIESGFHHVEAGHHEPRLLHIKGRMNKTIVRNVKLHASALNEGDVFILDLGNVLYQFNGKQAGIGEKSQAAKLTRSIDDERGSKVEIHVLTSADDEPAFWGPLGGKIPVASAAAGGSDTDLAEKKCLFQLSDKSGALQWTSVPVSKASLVRDDVFIFDCISVIWVWVGLGASVEERKNGLLYATRYLGNHPSRSVSTPIVRIVQGGENEEFEVSF